MWKGVLSFRTRAADTNFTTTAAQGFVTPATAGCERGMVERGWDVRER